MNHIKGTNNIQGGHVGQTKLELDLLKRSSGEMPKISDYNTVCSTCAQTQHRHKTERRLG